MGWGYCEIRLPAFLQNHFPLWPACIYVQNVSASPQGTTTVTHGAAPCTAAVAVPAPQEHCSRAGPKGGKRLTAHMPPGCADSSSPEQHGFPGHPGAPKVRRTRRGKNVPRANLSESPIGESAQERLLLSHVLPLCGRPEGSRPSGALPYGKGGVGRVDYLMRRTTHTPQSSTPGSAHNTSISIRPSKHADAGQGSRQPGCPAVRTD